MHTQGVFINEYSQENYATMERASIINYAALLDKIGEYAVKAGRATTRPVLLLYYVMKSKDTPRKDKLRILSTLSYLVLPIDILNARRLPIIGWINEIASLSITYQKVRDNITPKIEAKTDALFDRWFPEYTEYVEIIV